MLSGDFHHGFVGHHFNNHLILGDKLAGIDVPFYDFTFDNTFTDIRQNKCFDGAACVVGWLHFAHLLRRFLRYLRCIRRFLLLRSAIVIRWLKFK